MGCAVCVCCAVTFDSEITFQKPNAETRGQWKGSIGSGSGKFESSSCRMLRHRRRLVFEDEEKR